MEGQRRYQTIPSQKFSALMQTYFLLTKTDKRESENELAIALRDGKGEDDRWRLRKDGSRFWSSGIVCALHSEAGQMEGFVKFLRDLTEQRQAQENLRRSEEQFRLFVEHVTDYALIQVDLNGHVRFRWETLLSC